MASLRTLKLERHAARAPIWASRSGVPVEAARAWPEVPFFGEPFQIGDLQGALGPADLLVFTHLCSLYLARKPRDRRVTISFPEVAGWLGNREVGGSQIRVAAACLRRLRGATFSSELRFGAKGTERWVHGWGLIDEWHMPMAGLEGGWALLNATVARLLEGGSFVLLDALTLLRLEKSNGLAVRLWVFLEADSLKESGFDGLGQLYGVFAAPLGAPTPKRATAALADLLRLTDPRRPRVVANLRRACRTIERIDRRYQLEIEPAKLRRHGMWNLRAKRWSKPIAGLDVNRYGDLAGSSVEHERSHGALAGWGMNGGTLGDADPARWGMDGGRLGDAAGFVIAQDAQRSPHETPATWGMDGGGPRRASLARIHR